MTDSFADLWSSSAPTTSKPAEVPRKLGAYATGPPLSTSKPTNDVFSMLAAAGPVSSTSSRSTTPLYTNGAQGSQTPQPAYVPKQPIQKTVSSGSGDAFSGLLSGSFSSTSANNANMTIAERAALADRQRSAQLLQNQSSTQKQGNSAWAGLDALVGSPSLSNSKSAQSQSQAANDDWGFDFEPVKPFPASTSSASKQTTQPTHDNDDDDWLAEFSSAKPAAPAAKPLSKATSNSLFDELDDFTSTASQPKGRVSPEHVPRPRSPGDFDFGDREDGLLNGQSDDEDILGDLSKPVDQVLNRVVTPPQQRSGPKSRAPSPPPHILGRIVEMGFSIEQARVALASTDTGLNVEAALETLLASGAADSDRPPSRDPPRIREPAREASRRPAEEGRRRAPPSSRPARETPSPGVGDTQKNIQEQADKLLAQASELGLSMFSRANAFWKEGKERVQKVYEERQKASGSGASQPGNGRPKWMQEAEERDEELEAEWRAHKERGGFKDDHDILSEEVLPSRPQERRPKPQAREPEPQPSSSRTANLLSDDSPSVYVSPWRRKTPSRGQTPAAVTPPKAPTPRAPSPIQMVQRKTISAPPSALATSAKHKATGTEKFKLGQYAEAENAYSNAIAALPHSHLLLVPLYNNRALSRIKTGDHTGAVEDCTVVIGMIGTSYHPARETKVTKEDEGASVDIADAYVKAFKRRAEAYEGKEKWDLAKADWEVIAGTEWAKGNMRNEAVSGVGRCRRMVTANTDKPAPVPSRPKPTPQVRPRPTPKVVAKDSEALNRVREANQAAEAEDDERHKLKDVVDAKLIAWKGGKETNIRALIASLENVLWPELGWQKVGMHELVTPNQVKIRYTKAIAKLHPDKLNVRNTTLEQRMIANGVFGSLNDAWNAFK